jgi:hypothetical protein
MDFVERIIRIAKVEDIPAERLNLDQARKFLEEHSGHPRDDYSVSLCYGPDRKLDSIAIGVECYEDPKAKELGNMARVESSCEVYEHE